MRVANRVENDAGRLERRPRLVLPFKRDALSRFGVTCLVLLVIAAAIGPVFPIGNPDTIDAGPRLARPSVHFLLGTDSLGRSMLPRLVEGLQNSFLISATAVAIVTVLALILGTIAGYRGGILDIIVTRISDILFAFPTILLALLIAAILGPGERGIIIAIVLVTFPLMARVIREATLKIARRDFIVSAEVSGASLVRIVCVHVVPNVAGVVAVQMTYAMSIAMLTESGLSFLGLGIQPPGASLGSLASDGVTYMTLAPWLVFAPSILLALAILSVNLVGDGLRDRFEPRESRRLT